MNENDVKVVRIYSMIGQLKAEFSSTNNIDISEYERGVYFLELITTDDKRLVKRIVKEN